MKLLLQKMHKWKKDREVFFTFKNDVANYNINAMRKMSIVGFVGSLFLVIASLPPFRFLSLLECYAALTVVFGIMLLLSSTILKKYTQLILPFYYLFIIILLIFSIVMGTYLGTDTNATTFLILLLAIPLFIIDKPYKIDIVLVIMSLIFCVLVHFTKSGEIHDLDISNGVVICLLSIVVNRQSIRYKMTDIVIKHELKSQRDMDMLTKLNNRGAFERGVAQYIHDSNKNSVMMIMDIDNFKSVNDTMGHSYGDMVLQLVGEYLKSTFRTTDIVSRLGGDEFVAFLPAVSDMNIITKKVTDLINRIKNIPIESETPCKIGASVGLAQYPKDGCTFEDLYKQADLALYVAKKNGKGTYAIYDESTMKEKI